MIQQNHQMDMTKGPLMRQILLFSFPLVITGLLQVLFNTADVVVIGRYASTRALAAVGATQVLSHFIVSIFLGLSVGTNVLVSRFFGAKDDEQTSRALHTSMMTALVGGIGCAALTVGTAGVALRWMQTPAEVMEGAKLYMQIYGMGIPFLVIYSFGAAVMRSFGDSRRPLYYMVISGILNVVLNLIFVIKFHWDVAGVAWATLISELLSAVLVWRALCANTGSSKLQFSRLKIHWPMLKGMLAIGVPAGIQSASFSISNMMIQSSINSLGAACIASGAACNCMEGVIYISGFGFHQAVVSVVAQNLGARNYKRICKSLIYCILLGTMTNQIISWLFMFNGESVISIFNKDPEVIRWGLERMASFYAVYGICATMDVSSGGLRGLGRSFEAAVIAIGMICVLRALWVAFIFPLHRTIFCLMSSYPVSWILSLALNLYVLWRELRKLKRQFGEQPPLAAG